MSSEPEVRHKLSMDPRVISASRRADIPAFCSEWFMNRIRKEVVAVPNPNTCVPQLFSPIVHETQALSREETRFRGETACIYAPRGRAGL